MFNKLLPHLIALVAFFAVSAIYFSPTLQGKVMKMGDIEQNKAMAAEVRAYNKENDNTALWTNSMFGGMPAYQMAVAHPANKLTLIQQLISFGTSRPIAYFLIGSITFYIMLLLLGVNSWLALIGGLLFAFSTNNLILLEAGHSSKVNTLMLSPLIVSGVLLAFKKKYLIGLSTFALGMGMGLRANHPQMTYYLGMIMGILVLIYLINAIRNKELLDFAKSSGVLLAGLALAFAANTSLLWTTLEYAEDTMRGAPILKSESAENASSSQVDGLAWDYAMQWSNGYGDLLASFIPRVVGGGSSEEVSKDTQFARLIGSSRDTNAPLYFGSLPFTSGPIYFGALVCFLFLFGAFSYQSPVKWWLVAGVTLTLLMSLGKNLEWFNRLLFDYLPYLNKFRTPNSVLSVTAIFMPILGLLSINEMIKAEDKTRYLKAAKISALILGGIALIMALFNGLFFDFTSPSDARMDPRIAGALVEDRAAYVRSSSLRSLLFIGIGFGVIWAYVNNKLSTTVLIAIIGVSGLIDLMGVNRRYVDNSNFTTARKLNASYEPRQVDKKIMEDPALYYRVHDLTVDPFNTATPARYHKLIGGYHPAKLQRYQDVIERHISQNNMAVLNMLNAKYFIYPSQTQGGQETYQLNPAALGNAWFVSEIKYVDTPNEEIDALSGLAPAMTAIVHKEFEGYPMANNYNKNGTIELTSYSPMKLTYKSNSSTDQFAVFSEVWYGPDKGWKAYIDGVEQDFIRVNYLLRGMNVPSGQHEIVFEFAPRSYNAGSTISLIGSLAIILLTIGVIVYYLKNTTKLEA